MKVIVIDDDMVFRIIISDTMKIFKPSLNIIECEDGKEGLIELKEVIDSGEAIIIFLDINMPILNGWEFLEKIQEHGYENNQNLNVYLISSSTDRNDIIKAEQFSFLKGFLHKPITIEQIKEILA